MAKISVCCHNQNVEVSVLILIGRILLECLHSSVLVFVKSGLGALCFSCETQNRPTWDILKKWETLSKMIVMITFLRKWLQRGKKKFSHWNQGSVTVLIKTQYGKLLKNLIYLTLKKPINQFFYSSEQTSDYREKLFVWNGILFLVLCRHFATEIQSSATSTRW